MSGLERPITPRWDGAYTEQVSKMNTKDGAGYERTSQCRRDVRRRPCPKASRLTQECVADGGIDPTPYKIDEWRGEPNPEPSGELSWEGASGQACDQMRDRVGQACSADEIPHRCHPDHGAIPRGLRQPPTSSSSIAHLPVSIPRWMHTIKSPAS